MRKGHHTRNDQWDYSGPGTYMVNFNVAGHEHKLGEIKAGRMICNQAGEIVKSCWADLPGLFPKAELDEMVVMPDHVHAIIKIHDFHWVEGEKIEPKQAATRNNRSFEPLMAQHGTILGKVVRAWKAKACKLIREKHDKGFTWQSRFHEDVIKCEKELEARREYIRKNPEKRGLK